MDQGVVESGVDWIYKRAGFETDEARSTVVLATRSHGAGCIIHVPHQRWAEQRGTLRGKTIISLRASLPPVVKAHKVGHALAHDYLDAIGYDEPDTEDMCESIGAGCMTPAPAFRRAIRVRGRTDYAQLALDFRTTETMVALRAAEITGEPMALVAPLTVRVRNEWHGPQTIEQIRSLVRREVPGISRAQLTDDRKRWVFREEERFDEVG